MNELANLFNVMPHMITFRVGMIMKNIHTFFEYVKGSVKMDINTAKNIAGWDDVVDNNVFGGYPPTCDDISIEKEKLHTFINQLFCHQEGIDSDVQYLLTASIFWFYQEYCNLVSNEPDGLFKNGSVMNHRFINKIENAKRLTGVDESTFVAWQNEVISAFNRRNEFALTGDVEGFEEIGVKPFVKVVRTQAIVIDKINQQVKNQTEIISELQKDYSSMKDNYNHLFTNYQQLASHFEETRRTMGMMLELQKQTLAASVGASSNIDNHHLSIVIDNPDLSTNSQVGASVDESEITESIVTTDTRLSSEDSAGNISTHSTSLSFSQIHEQYLNQSNIGNIFYNYYTKDLEAAYESWKKDAGKGVRNKIYNKMNSVRQVVLYMIMFHKSVPEPKPSGVAEEGAWDV